ncbi:MAG: hypothetical protein WBM02_03480 [bacterium]
MHPDLQLLIEIQSYSDKRAKSQIRCREIPEQINELDEELMCLKKKVEHFQEKIREYKLKINICEGKIKELKEKQGNHRAQLFKLKSNREYQAMNTEIELLAEKISLLETEIIESMEIIDKARDEYDAGKEKLSSEEDRLTKDKKRLDSELQNEKLQLGGFEKAYLEKRNALSEELLDRYDRLIRKHGRAVAELVEKNCGNCCMRVQPQIAAAVQSNSELVNCDKCGVFLFVKEGVVE